MILTKGVWSVSYEIWDEESREIGETDDKGFIVEDTTLSWALHYLGVSIDIYGQVVSPSLIFCNAIPPYICAEKFNEGTRAEIEQGLDEQRHLHIPHEMKPESIRRLCKLLNVRECNI